MILSVLSPLASSLAKPSTARSGSVVLRAGFSTQAAKVDPTKIHLYKSNNCDENEIWQHTPFAEREKEMPIPKAATSVKEDKNIPYYRKLMSSPLKKKATEPSGLSPKSGGQGSKITSM